MTPTDFKIPNLRSMKMYLSIDEIRQFKTSFLKLGIITSVEASRSLIYQYY